MGRYSNVNERFCSSCSAESPASSPRPHRRSKKRSQEHRFRATIFRGLRGMRIRSTQSCPRCESKVSTCPRARKRSVMFERWTSYENKDFQQLWSTRSRTRRWTRSCLAAALSYQRYRDSPRHLRPGLRLRRRLCPPFHHPHAPHAPREGRRQLAVYQPSICRRRHLRHLLPPRALHRHLRRCPRFRRLPRHRRAQPNLHSRAPRRRRGNRQARRRQPRCRVFHPHHLNLHNRAPRRRRRRNRQARRQQPHFRRR